MNVGMLWFDNDPRKPLADKVAAAAEYYQKRYGHSADLCLVHPTMFQETPPAGKITIRSNRAILPGHLWMGVDLE